MYPHWSTVSRETGKMDCAICGDRVDPKDFTDDEFFVAGPNYTSVDHVIPLAAGGSNEIENLQLAHMFCNSLKGAA